MSKTLLQIHFNFSGPFGEEMTQQLVGLAESINEAGLHLENLDRKRNQQAGGIYLLRSKKRRRPLLKTHLRV